MKTNSSYPQTALRFIAALLFCLLLAPPAWGQEGDTPSNWKDHLNGVDKIANGNGGDGSTWENAIVIASAEELAYFAQQVNSNASINYGDGRSIGPADQYQAGGFISYYFALSADIDLSDYDWTPIGNATYPFKGNFDGRGHCVKGLEVMKVETVSGAAYAGLFGCTSVGILRNLGVRLADAGIQANSTGGSAYAGGIAGYAHKIFNCYVVGEGTIEASFSGEGNNIYAGGIVGYLDDDGSLINCYATVNVKVEPKGIVNVGGIVGYGSSNSTISCTYATGDVETGTGAKLYYAGGICGYLRNEGTLTNSLAVNGRITGGNSFSNRIVGNKESNSTLTGNYASFDIPVNGKLVSGGGTGEVNGDPDINLDNLQTALAWGDGWDTSDPTRLPLLKMRTGDDPTYEDWPAGPGYTAQSPPVASDYLIAGKLANKGGGDGSNWEKAILIADWNELAYFAQQVNSQQSIDLGTGSSIEYNDQGDSGFSAYYFALSADIDLSVRYWIPIGIDDYHPFKGNFDGRGYGVKGLKVSDVKYAGLFGYIQGGTIQNLGVALASEGITATGNNDAYAGGIAGELNHETIRNCYVTGNGTALVTGSQIGSAGGIVGTGSGSTIIHCYATIKVKVDGGNCNAGGIAGTFTNGSISCTYSTGVIQATTGEDKAAGICATVNVGGSVSNNLALNRSITGNGQDCHRITGKLQSDPGGSVATATTNYATTMTVCSFTPVADLNGPDGAPTFLKTFVDDLKGDGSNGWNEGWEDFSSGTYLPQLKMWNQAGNDYEPWNPSASPQLSLKAEDYLLAFPKLHIVSPIGGTLTVTDEDGNGLPEGIEIRPGTLLTLAYSENTNYRFSGYLSGSSVDNLAPLTGNTIPMPIADLWLSARFNYYDPTPPPPPDPVYYAVTLPAVEGVTTDPMAGSYLVESWDSFRFYLMLDTAYSQSQPVVTTSRNETLVPHALDGAYVVEPVYTNVNVFIDGVVKNPDPVSNEIIRTADDGPKIWTEPSYLCIRTAEDDAGSLVRILTFDGHLLHIFRSVPGLNRRQLPTGLYIVQIGDDKGCKMIVR